MTEKEYNEAEGVRRSDLWRMEDSAEKFRYFLDHPVEQTPAMAFGSACHKMILETASTTPESAAFYLALGYTEIGYYGSPAGAENCRCFEKVLSDGTMR